MRTLLINEFENAINTRVKKGVYYKVGWQTKRLANGQEYVKISVGVARFLKAQDKEVVLTSKANVKYVRLFLTHNNKHITKVSYFCDGVGITKEEYEQATGETTKQLDVCFAKHLDDILYIQNKTLQVQRG